MTITRQASAAVAPSSDVYNDEANAFFEGLRGLLAACGPKPNKNDAAIVLISACIEGGRDTRPRIVGTLKRLGFNYRHVAIILNGETGNDPKRHRWQLGAEGRYTLHDDG